MTRKKQGAPQRLNSQSEAPKAIEPDSLELDVNDNSTSRDTDDTETTTDRKAQDDEPDEHSSCQKLLEFTKNFYTGSFASGNATSGSTMGSVKQEPHLRERLPDSQSNSTNDKSAPSSSLIAAKKERPSSCDMQETVKLENTEATPDLPMTLEGSSPCNKLSKNSEKSSQAKEDANPSVDENDQSNSLPDPSLNATHRLLMDAMLRQQSNFYEQCTNNWMSVQRSDNNCMSKSKAERYRWCVQGNDSQHKLPKTSPQSHVTNLKKSASMAGFGVTPVQDKLYSAVLAGASKFCCRDCGNPFNTLVDLTIHMNKTGHFRDTNVEDKATPDASKPLNTTKKRPMLDDDNLSENVLTCMGCGHLFESLQDLSVHMMKTKHYENVPSLRMWSQKQAPSGEVPPSSKKRSQPPSGSGGKKTDSMSSVVDAAALARSSMTGPPHFGGISPSSHSAYANLLLGSPWLASTLPNPFFSLFSSSPAYPYNYGFPGVFPGLLSNLSPSFEEYKDSPFVSCTQCRETFTSFQKMVEHVQETSHFPKVDSSWPINLPSCSSSQRSSASETSSPLCSQREDKQDRDYFASSASASKASTIKSHIEPTSPKTKKEQSSSSFDFIRSIESTIKSAISKVESPHGNTSSRHNTTSHENDRTSHFSPFFTMHGEFVRPAGQHDVNSSDVAKRKLSAHKFLRLTENRCEVAQNQAITSTVNSRQLTDFSNKLNGKARGNVLSTCALERGKSGTSKGVEKADSPLDLTVRRDAALRGEYETSRPVSDKTKPPNQRRFSSSADRRCSSNSSPCDMLLNNHPVSTSSVSNTPPKCSGSSSKYSPSSKTKSPLQNTSDGMQTLFAFMKPRVEAAINQDCSSSTANSLTHKKSRSESYKPLMAPGGESLNPLKEMLKIVNNTDAEKRQTSRLIGTNFLDSYSRKRSSMESTALESKKYKMSRLLQDLVVPSDDSSSNDNPLQRIQDLVDNKLQSSQSSTSIHQPSETLFSSSNNFLPSLPSQFTRATSKSLQVDPVNVPSTLTIIHPQNSRMQTERNRAMSSSPPSGPVFTKSEGSPDDCERVSSPDSSPSNSKEDVNRCENLPVADGNVKKKYTIQGAVCFGSYLNHVTSSRDSEVGDRSDDVTPHNNIDLIQLKRHRLPHMRCADKVSTSDDGIRITS